MSDASASDAASASTSTSAAAPQPPAPSLNTSAVHDHSARDDDHIATVQTTASTTKKKEEMRNESTGITVGDSAHTLADGKTIHYSAERIIGNGSFGVVFQASVEETGEIVAIKKVLQDKRFKNRELQIMRQLSHTNIVQLKHCFYCNGEKPDELYLNLVLEFIPDTVYGVARQLQKAKQYMPVVLVKLYIYQICRALAYIHATGICHRDIKPQNLLLDPRTHVVKLCDFGSAKVLQRNEPNVSYICSRYYRAPELIFGATDYTTAIDVWSLGCVCAELLLGQPLFPGESGVDQLVEIIKVLGTPQREEIEAMNPNYTEFQFPQIKAHSWNKIFRSRTPPEAIDLLEKMLVYDPKQRVKPLEAAAHPFFDELRLPNLKLPNDAAVPLLFDFTPQELALVDPRIREILVPEHERNASNWVGATASTAPAPAAASTAASDHDAAK